jgi:hypothetical protein
MQEYIRTAPTVPCPLDPRNPHIGFRYLLIGTVLLLQSRTDEAIVWFEKGRSAMPTVPFHHSWLASAYALKDETERAAAELAEARRNRPGPPAVAVAGIAANRQCRLFPQPNAISMTPSRSARRGRPPLGAISTGTIAPLSTSTGSLRLRRLLKRNSGLYRKDRPRPRAPLVPPARSVTFGGGAIPR